MTTSSKSVMPPANMVPAPRGKGRRRALLAASVLWPLSAPLAFGQDHALPGANGTANAAAKSGLSAAQITPGNTSTDAVKVLLDQANYWRSQYQPVKAVDALNRVLQIDPNNADALATMAQVQADRGNISAAQNALGRLRTASPGDSRIPTIYQTLRVGPIDPHELKQARSLAEEGRPADAVDQYKQIFKGNGPTPGLATEYYSVLSGTDHGWDDAKKGLAAQVSANPQDLRAQLSYAQLLTYRESSRADGINRLNQLAANPSSAAGANAALRQALLWLPANSSSIGQLQSYLTRHPSDTEIQQHLEAARHPSGSSPADEAGRVRVEGFSDLNHGRLDRADSQFETALKNNPNDADALGGLGLVRLRQGRTAEAHRLLDRAIRLDPSKRRQWQSALSGASGGPSTVGREWDQVRKLAASGDYAAAEAHLRPLLGPNESNTGGLLLLADIQQRGGRLQDAEATYRVVLNRQANNSAAVIGLAGILSHEGRGPEADQLYARAESMGARGVGQLRAQQLRVQAEEVSDPIAQAGLYRAAIAVDPTNPWVRLELARLLLREHRTGEAHAVMEGVGTGRNASMDSVRAGILFANESNDPATALALINRIPAKQRTPDLQRAAAQAQVRSEIAAATQYYYINRPMARERLLAIAATPDRSGIYGTEVARAFLAMNDRFGVREAISTAMASSRGMISPEARVAFSGILLQAGQTQAAAALANSAAMSPGLAPDQQTALTNIESGIAVRSADQLNQSGRTADAYDRLAPALEHAPTNPDLNMALSRLYAANDQPKQALAINEALLRQDPNNLAVRKAAVEAAIQADETGRARRMIQDALQMWPNDPQVWVMSAQLAKADGDNGRALHDYQTALQLRQRQLHGSDEIETPVGAVGAPGGHFGPAPNILTVPGNGGNYPGQMPGGTPMPLDMPRRSNQSSENEEGQKQRFADDENSDPNGDSQVHLAEQALPHVALAQARFPYYVSPAPELSSTPATADAGTAYAAQGYAPAPADATTPYQSYGAPAYPAPAYQQSGYAPSGYAPYAPAPYVPPTPSYAAQPSYAPAPYAPAPYQGGQYQAPATYQGNPYQGAQYQGGQYQAAPFPQAPAPRAAAAPVPYQSPYSAPVPSMNAFGGGMGGVPDAFSADNGGYANPFRAAATTPSTPEVGILGIGAPVQSSAPTDAMSQEIDTNIQTLRDQMAPSVQAGVGIRHRTGTQGLDSLTEETLPVEATYSPGVGQLRVQAAPTFLQGGTDNGSANDRSRFGTLPLYDLSPNTPAPRNQTASGVGLDVTYGWKWVSVDVGSTPFGFQEQNVIGGVELSPQINNELRVRIDGERRAVTDSVLSYAGTKDDRTGQNWGGVIDTSIHAQLEYGGKDGLNLYGGGGFGSLDGSNTESNQQFQAAVGGSYPVFRAADKELRLGLDLDYFGYQRNEDFFTYGYGGYFSPQSYFAALIPLTYREKDGDLNWSVGASVGFQTYRQDRTNVFPDSNLQSQLTAVANNISTFYNGQSETGFAGGLQAEATYKLTPAWSIGGRAGLQHTGDFTETGGMVFARYAFGIE